MWIERPSRNALRYFFHFKRGQMTILDQEGVDLAGITEAAEEAARRGRAIATRDALKSVPFSISERQICLDIGCNSGFSRWR